MESRVESRSGLNTPESAVDVMQVCHNGHVITASLYREPQQGLSHCDRCGAATLDRCATCGHPLRGSTVLPGLTTVGRPRPPSYCDLCGAAFPWAQPLAGAAQLTRPTQLVESFLRRVPRVARQLRDRHGDRTPFRIQDDYDLEDLVRSLLPIHFDEVHLESRTPAYTVKKRTDFRICPDGIVLTVKLSTPTLRESQLAGQWTDDLTFYRRQPSARLVLFVYDPQGLLHDPGHLEAVWAAQAEGLSVSCVIAG